MDERELPEILEEHYGQFVWQFIMAGYRRQEITELLAETHLYVAERWHKYDPSRAKPTTWLYQLARGAIQKYRRRENRFVTVLSEPFDKKGGEEETCAHPDLLSESGRDIEDRIGEQEMLREVLRVAKERGITLPADGNLSPEQASVLRGIWAEVEEDACRIETENIIHPDKENDQRTKWVCPNCVLQLTLPGI